MTTVQGGTIVVRVEGRDIGLSELLSRINSQMTSSVSVARNYSSAMAQIDPVLRRADQELARYAQSLAAVAAKSGDTATAQRILAQALGQITPNTTAANQVLNQLQGLLNTTGEAAQKKAFNLQNLATGLQTLVGAYLVATRVVGEFGEAVNKGNELEKTLLTFRVLSKDQETYQKNLAEARQQQNLFGGSLQDTVEGMSSFANLSRKTGIEISKLTNLARAMAIIDPAQGFKGAGIALKEFFSGDITSLARRFEIPRDDLNKIKNIADEGERFAALEKTLAEFGITTELLGAQASSTAVAYAKLSGSAADATAAIGRGLAELLKTGAENTAFILDQVAQGITALVTASEQLQNINFKIFDKTDNVDAFNAKIREVNEQLPFFAGKLQELTPAQFAFAKELTGIGLSFDEVIQRVQSLQPLIADISDTFNSAGNAGRFSADQINEFSFAALNAASVTAEGQEVARAYAAAVLEGSITIAEGTTFLQQYVQVEQQAAQARDQGAQSAATAAQEQAKLNEALNTQASEALNTAQATDQLKQRQQELLAVITALSNGSITQSQAESILAKNYGVTAGQLPGLISLTLQLAAARQAAAAADYALAQAKVSNQRVETSSSDELDIQKTKHDLVKEQTNQIKAQQAAINSARRDQVLTVGTHQQQLKLLQDEYNTMVKLHGADSALAIQAETALKKEQQQKQKGAGGAGGKLSDQEKLNNSLLASQDKFNDKFEDADIKHFDKLSKIYDDYAKKTQEQLAKNEVSKRRSRADFYSSLQDASGVDVTKFAASYEEAFKQAQDIAASGKAKLADEFLKLRQDQIKEMLDLEKEAADIRDKEQSGDLSKKDADAQLAFLEGRKKLVQDAQDEEQKQLLAAGDDNQNRLQEQLDAEQEAYTTNTDKIALQAERAADAKITAAERAKKKVSEENTVLLEQSKLYERIAATNGGRLPQATATAPVDTITNPATPQADKTIDVTASQPIPIQSADVLLVRQVEMFIVHDQEVAAILSDGVTRLENRLIEVTNSVNSARDVISGSVKAVESAIGRIRPNSPNVVGP